MKVKVKADRRSAIDREYDDMYNKMLRESGINARQSVIVKTFLRAIVRRRIQEIEAAVEMGYLLALIETERFGTSPKSTRLKRVQARAAEHINEAYSRGYINANGFFEDYDGCGYERLKAKLHGYGLEYEGK
jgi:hypothetical protein